MAKRPYKPIKITAHMDGAICGELPMLDSLLEWVMSFHMSSISVTCSRHPLQVRCRGQDIQTLGTIPIGIERRQMGGLPIPRCSSPIAPEPEWDDLSWYHKRWSEGRDLLRSDRRVVLNQTGGALKAYRLPLRIRLVSKIVWFAYGSQYEVRRRLRTVLYLGKKTSFGYGRVKEWVVEPVEEDFSWTAECGDKLVLMRPIPLTKDLPSNLRGYRLDYGSPCPPYWRKSSYCDMLVPV